MRKAIAVIFKIILWIVLLALTAFLAVRMAGQRELQKTPEGGINESFYVELNGAKQWINIYGENINNPVLLYLHGGPGSSTSDIDYAFTRKWADVYTVVTWDQRNCGKSYSREQNGTALTRELFLSDGRALTEFLRSYLAKDKITILGHSWGSLYGANLVLACPEYYDCFIGAGQLVDLAENEAAFIEEAYRWAGDDAETVIFNPNYSLADWVKYFFRDRSVYEDFFNSDELRSFSLKDRTEYPVPYYNINGDRDYQTNYKLAQAYFDRIKAPYKQMFLMENMTHGLLESRSEEFSDLVHRIAETEKTRYIWLRR